MRMVLWILVFGYCSNITASDSIIQVKPDSALTIAIKKDSRLEELNRKFALNNKRVSLKPHMVRERGFRLQVISTQNRTAALSLKAELLNRFPAEKTYLIFQAPLFKVRMGNFKTRKEAADFAAGYLGFLPQVFIIADIIEYMWYPPKEEDE